MSLACVLAAGLEGIARSFPLRPSSSSQERGESRGRVEEKLPKNFRESLECLQKDDFLVGLLGEGLVRGYVKGKEREIEVYGRGKEGVHFTSEQ